jgi:YidC/Oxa1 family membrane protein insertase
LSVAQLLIECFALQAAAQDDGWLAPISNGLNYSLTQIQIGLDQLHVPYSYGWAIIVLTVGTKILTFPFTKVQARLLAFTLHRSQTRFCNHAGRRSVLL